MGSRMRPSRRYGHVDVGRAGPTCDYAGRSSGDRRAAVAGKSCLGAERHPTRVAQSAGRRRLPARSGSSRPTGAAHVGDVALAFRSIRRGRSRRTGRGRGGHVDDRWPAPIPRTTNCADLTVAGTRPRSVNRSKACASASRRNTHRGHAREIEKNCGRQGIAWLKSMRAAEIGPCSCRIQNYGLRATRRGAERHRQPRTLRRRAVRPGGRG